MVKEITEQLVILGNQLTALISDGKSASFILGIATRHSFACRKGYKPRRVRRMVSVDFATKLCFKETDPAASFLGLEGLLNKTHKVNSLFILHDK